MSRWDYDIVVIGGGPSGLVSAKMAAGLGKRVALIEKNKLGGGCTWTGCVPSKTLIRVAQVAHEAAHMHEFGLDCTSGITIDTSKVMAHVRRIVTHIYQTHTPEQLKQKGIDVLFGSPRFIDRHTVIFNGKQMRAKKFMICTGTRPFIPKIPGLESVDYLTSENVFLLDKLPESVLILGGGPVGIEMACSLNRLGVRVILVEMKEQILSKEDPEIAALLAKKLTHEGVSLLLKTTAKAVKSQNNSMLLVVDTESVEQEIEAERLFIAVGRTPQIEGLGFEAIALETNRQGIVVTPTLQTTISNIYACGDVVGPYRFSHMAEYQAILATRNALIPFFKKRMDLHNVAWVTFTEPELARAGLSEIQAREQYGDQIEIYRVPYAQNDRAMIDNHELGLAKIIVGPSGKILGTTILGSRAGELIHEIQFAKYNGFRLDSIYHVIHAYPTYSEILWHAARKAYVKKLKSNFLLRIARRLFGYGSGKA